MCYNWFVSIVCCDCMVKFISFDLDVSVTERTLQIGHFGKYHHDNTLCLTPKIST